MSDILKRLQACAIAGCSPPERALALEAANEIARLREERRSITTLFGKVESLEADNAKLREDRRWVPVGERLPPPGATVLMLMDGKDPVSGWYENGHFHNAYDQPNVTHWQPLPPGAEANG